MGKGNRTRNSKYQETYDMAGSGAAAKAVKPSQKKDYTSAIIIAVIVAILALSLVLVIFSGSGIKDRNTIVVSSDNYEVTGTMFSYYEGASYMNMYSYYLNLYYSYFGDYNTAMQYASQALSGQDFFAATVDTVKELLVLCESAKAAGLSLDDDDKTAIEETIKGYDGNFAASFGTGVKAKDVRRALELQTLAGKYYDKYHEETEAAITEDEISKYIDEHKADFFATHYLKAELTLEVKDFTDNADFEAAKALVDKYAPFIEAAKTEKEFKNQLIRYIVDRDFDGAVDTHVSEDIMPTAEVLKTHKDEIIADLTALLVDEKEEVESDANTELEKAMNEVFTELKKACDTVFGSLEGEQAYVATPESEDIKWLVSDKTPAFDTYAVKSSTEEEYSHVIYMVTEPLHLEDEETVSVGHILVKAEEGTATEEEMKAAEEKACEILDSYLAGEKTREAFEKLGEEKTEDSNVFYENVTEGQMVEAFNDWIFSEDRKEVGETDIVKTEFGYHVMYWDGKGETTSVVSAKEGIVEERYTAYIEEGEKALTLNEKYIAKNTAETEASN